MHFCRIRARGRGVAAGCVMMCAPVFLWEGADAPGTTPQLSTVPERVDVQTTGLLNEADPFSTVNPAGERRVRDVHRPTISPFLPDRDCRHPLAAAVLVIPGGGHSFLCVDHEGEYVARELAARGFAAFVLKHRLARPENATPYKLHRPPTVGHSVLDTQRAIRLIRARAREFNIDPSRVGVMGFSAGGECAAWAAMLDGHGQRDADDCVERESARPDFQALIYPGRPDDIQPTGGANHPPAFLCASSNQRLDGPGFESDSKLAEVYLRFVRAGASAELHMFTTDGHGFGYRPAMATPPLRPVGAWLQRFTEWLCSGVRWMPPGGDGDSDDDDDGHDAANVARTARL